MLVWEQLETKMGQAVLLSGHLAPCQRHYTAPNAQHEGKSGHLQQSRTSSRFFLFIYYYLCVSRTEKELKQIFIRGEY